MTNRAIALVPGFLGFDHLNKTNYFATRFCELLKEALQARSRDTFAIHPVTTHPIGSLAERQQSLLDEIAKVDERGTLWHVIGHSAGGLDAALLARGQRLEDTPAGSRYANAAFDPDWQDRLCSVVTIAAPHYGTTLASTPAARGTATGKWTVAAAEQILAAGFDLLDRRDLIDRLKFFAGSVAAGQNDHFLLHLLTGNELARDLTAEVASRLTREGNSIKRIGVSSIATITPHPVLDGGGYHDHFFEALWTWVYEAAGSAPPVPLDAKPLRLVASDPGLFPEIEQGDNDGVVNTARQVAPASRYAALVLADHGDVIGRYQRTGEDGEVVDPGLLTSGAGFKDAQFQQLIDVVAEEILLGAR